MNNKFFKVVNFANTNDLNNCQWQTWYDLNKIDDSLEEKPGIAMWQNEETTDFIKKCKPDATINFEEDTIAIYYL